jgi:hypothetical protein
MRGNRGWGCAVRNSSQAFTIFLIVNLAVLLCFSTARAQADSTKFNQTYEAAIAKAQETCKALWADHVFDPVRDRIPLGEEKPTFEMLKNSERMSPKDRPLADLAIKTLERCRAAYAPAYALLPPDVVFMIQGLQQKQDALIAQLYVRKITFGEYNVQMNQIQGDFARALSGVAQVSEPVASVASGAIGEPRSAVPLPRPRLENRNVQPVSDTRIALVIGNSSYSNLPKLANTANDAAAIAEVLKKLGTTRTRF